MAAQMVDLPTPPFEDAKQTIIKHQAIERIWKRGFEQIQVWAIGVVCIHDIKQENQERIFEYAGNRGSGDLRRNSIAQPRRRVRTQVR
jgi:hypothetical protein